jgi:hypothetical protein
MKLFSKKINCILECTEYHKYVKQKLVEYLFFSLFLSHLKKWIMLLPQHYDTKYTGMSILNNFWAFLP